MTGHGYDAFDDPYVYKGTSVLRNKLGIRDEQILENFELEMSTLRADEPLPSGKFDARHYLKIHRHLFQDVYTWAGRPRTVRTSKGGNVFCFPEHIDGELKKLFSNLLPNQTLAEMSPNDYCAWAAGFLSELNAIHAFREGNGRAQLAFLSLLSSHVEQPLRLEQIQQRPFMEAMVESFSGSTEPLRNQLIQMRA